MYIALLALVAALQTQAPAPQVVRVSAVAPARPATAPATPAAPAVAVETAVDAVVEAAAEPEVSPGAEPAAPEPQTRQICRYVEVTGQRFPVRRCRTVVVEDR
jgi:NAD(P)-dependent dehydrogenase (short-subunit alcohol dehydrogenase family)